MIKYIILKLMVIIIKNKTQSIIINSQKISTIIITNIKNLNMKNLLFLNLSYKIDSKLFIMESLYIVYCKF